MSTRSARRRRTARQGLPRRAIATALAVVALGSGGAGIAAGASGGTGPLASVVVQEGLCETTGGGEFVAIPGFPGAQITPSTSRSRDSFQARACSRPPLPITRIFMD